MNLIFCAYAYKEQYQTGHNIVAKDSKDVYLKNSFVSLFSAKAWNPTCDVALVTNIDVGEEWKKRFADANIQIIKKEYDDFVFEQNYGWSLAYYKLCAMQHVLHLEYENYVLLDTDTYTQRQFDDIFLECKHNILLQDISKGFYNGDYRLFIDEIQRFLDIDKYYTWWGGEFIAGNKALLLRFIEKCQNVYIKIKEEKFVTINGDEFISSIAAHEMRDCVKNAIAYVFRYWTGWNWYYVCSNYRHNPVCVLHCPREKDYGFLKLYKYIIKKKKLPKIGYVYRKLSLDGVTYLKRKFVMWLRVIWK